MSKFRMRRFIVRIAITLTLGFVVLAGLQSTVHAAPTKAPVRYSPVGTWKATVYFISGTDAGKQEEQIITFNGDGTGQAETTGGNVAPIGTTSRETWYQVSGLAFIYQFDEPIYSDGALRGRVHGQVTAIFLSTGTSYAGLGKGTFILPNGTVTSFTNKTVTLAKLS